VKRILAAVALAVLPATAGAASEIDELSAALDRAMRAYDTAAATQLLAKVRSLHGEQPTAELAELHGRNSLAVAELLRVELEWLPKGQPATRRPLGQRIDANAREGLRVLSTLPDSSDVWRIRADLIATLIRSDFRAKKYQNEFKAAVARALEMDDGNARAWVSSAKPYLFAPERRGKDLDEAVRLLGRALELDPGLESARLLRALAHDELGNTELARADWQIALDNNPDCKPALRALGKDAEEPGR
jgi:tetratricopeptide (TPR) repeat protein